MRPLTIRDELISVQSELEYLDSYIQIQKIRYKDRLDFLYMARRWGAAIPDSEAVHSASGGKCGKILSECSMDVCMIRVDIHRSGKMLLVKVSNTGSAFAENVLEKLGTGELDRAPSGCSI